MPPGHGVGMASEMLHAKVSLMRQRLAVGKGRQRGHLDLSDICGAVISANDDHMVASSAM